MRHTNQKTGRKMVSGVVVYKSIMLGLAALVAGAFFSLPAVTYAAATLDATSTSGSAGSSTTIIWNHRVGNGADSLLVVTLSANASLLEPVRDISYDGVPLTELEVATSAIMTPMTSEIWYLKNPTVGLHPVSVSLIDAQQRTDIIGGGYTFFGVDQTDPFDVATTSQGCTIPGNLFSCNVSSVASTFTTTGNNEYIVDALSVPIPRRRQMRDKQFFIKLLRV